MHCALVWQVWNRDDRCAADLLFGEIKSNRFSDQSVFDKNRLQMLPKRRLDGRDVLAVHLDKIGERSDNRRAVKLRIVQTFQDGLGAGAQSSAFFVQLLQHLQFGLALRQGPLIRAEVAVDLLQFLLRIGKFVLAVVQFIPAGLDSCLRKFKLVSGVRDQVSKLTLVASVCVNSRWRSSNLVSPASF